MKETTVSNATLPPLQAELPEALREPTRSKSLLFMILYTVANMVIGVGNITIGSILLAEHVALFAPASQTTIFSLILGLGAIVAVVANPLIGMLSDRTTSRWGRRRLWYITGGVGTVLILLMMGQAPSLLVVAIGYILLQVTINMLQVALSALIPDQVPVRQRATISALSNGAGTLLGGLIGQTLVAQFFKGIPAAYTSLAIAIAIMVALFLLVLRETPLPKEHVPQRQLRQFLTMLRPLARREFALIWVARCLMFLAYSTVSAFMFFYLQDVVHYAQIFPGHSTAQGVQAFFGVNVLSIILASLIGGVLSDRLLRRKAFVIASSVIMAMGLLLYALFPIWSMVLVGTAVMAAGFGIYLGVDFALASQVLPAAADRGKDVGLFQSAIFLPMALSPVVAGITLSLLHSYLALFALLAIGTLLAAVLIIPIKSVR